MSSARVKCPKCRTTFQARVDESTTRIDCPHCGKVLQVKPKPKQPTAAPVEQPTPPESDPFGEEAAPADSFGSDGDGDTYQLATPEPDAPDGDPFADGFESASGDDEPWSDLDDEDLSGGETLRSKRSMSSASASGRKKKSWKREAEERRQQIKQTMKLWAAGAGAIVFLCTAGILFLLFGRGGDDAGGGNFQMADVVGDYGKISSGNFIQVEPTPVDNQPAKTGSDQDLWIAAQSATAEGPPTDGGAAPWQPMNPRSPREFPEFTSLRHRPAAWNDTHYLSVEIADIPDSPDRGAIWRVFELQTNRELGERVSMGSAPFPAFRPPPPLVALSSDGQWVAGMDYQDPTKVRLWNTGGDEQGDFVPLEHHKVTWLGFGADGQILSLANDVLSARSVPDCELLWKVEQQKPAFVVPGEHGDWLAMGHEKSIDLIDLKSGDRRGRLTLAAAEFVTDIAISPDESRLLASYMGGFGKSEPRSMLAMWDLQSGSARRMQGVIRRKPIGPISRHLRSTFWVNADWIVSQSTSSPPYFVCDNANGWFPPTGLRLIPDPTTEIAKSTVTFPGPGGRVWAQAKGDCWPIEFEIEEGEDFAQRQAEAVDQIQFTPPATSVAIEVDAGDEERSRWIGQAAASQLKQEGIHVVKNGPRLRATFSLSAGSDTLEFGSREITTPRVSVAWTYLDEEGNSQWTEEYGRSWKAEQSKFKKGFPDHMRSGEVIYRFEFPGNPKQDMFEEVMSNRWEVPHAAIERLKPPPPPQIPLPELPVDIRIVGPTAGELESEAEKVARMLENDRAGLLAEGGLPGRIRDVTFGSDGKEVLATVERGGRWWLMTLDVDQMTWGQPQPLTEEREFTLSPGLNHFATLQDTGAIPIVTVTDFGDTPAVVELEQPPAQGGLRVEALGLSPSGDLLFRRMERPGDPSRIDIWDLATQQQVLEISGEAVVARGIGLANLSAGFADAGTHFVTVGKHVTLWSTDTWQQLGTTPFPETIKIPSDGSVVPFLAQRDSLSFSRDGQVIAVIGHAGERAEAGYAICLWNMADLHGEGEVAPERIFREKHRLSDVSLDTRGRLLAFRSAEDRQEQVEVYSRDDGRSLRQLRHSGPFALSPAGDMLAFAGEEGIRIYSVSTDLEKLAGIESQPQSIPNATGFDWKMPSVPSTDTPSAGDAAADKPDERETRQERLMRRRRATLQRSND